MLPNKETTMTEITKKAWDKIDATLVIEKGRRAEWNETYCLVYKTEKGNAIYLEGRYEPNAYGSNSYIERYYKCNIEELLEYEFGGDVQSIEEIKEAFNITEAEDEY